MPRSIGDCGVGPQGGAVIGQDLGLGPDHAGHGALLVEKCDRAAAAFQKRPRDEQAQPHAFVGTRGRPRLAGGKIRLAQPSQQMRGIARPVVADRHDDLPAVVAGAKLVDVGAVPAFLAAGWSGVAYRRFLGWVALCTALRVSVLVALGVLAGEHLAARVEGVLDRPWLAVLGGLAVGAVLLGLKSLVGAALRAVRQGGVLLEASFAV